MKKIVAAVLLSAIGNAHAFFLVREPVLIYKDPESVLEFYSFIAPEYTSNQGSLDALNKWKPASAPVRITEFKAEDGGTKYLMCRGSYPLYAPGKVSYEAFLANSIKHDLSQAGLYADDAPTELSGYIKKIDFTSMGNPQWEFEAVFSTPGRQPVTVRHTHSFETKGRAAEICDSVTGWFSYAVGDFLEKLYTDPGFKQLIETKPPAQTQPQQ